MSVQSDEPTQSPQDEESALEARENLHVDPNSGAAPQPGGWAGADAYLEGHGQAPVGIALSEEGKPEALDFPEAEGELDEFDQAEMVEAKMLETQAMSPDNADVESNAPDPNELAGDGELDEFTTQEMVEAKVLETQGIDVSSDDDEEDSGDAGDSGGDAGDSGDSGGAGDSGDGGDAGGGEGGGESPTESTGGQYDELLAGNVARVQAYMDEHPDERDAVIQAERDRAAAAGTDPRKGITGDA